MQCILQCRRCRRQRFHPWVGKSPWRRTYHPPMENPMDSGAWRVRSMGCKEPDRTERLSTHEEKSAAPGHALFLEMVTGWGYFVLKTDF